MGCACYEEHNDQRSVLYMEQWELKEHLDRHIQSSLYNRVLCAMDLACEVPEIFFHEVSKTMEMDLVEALRARGEQTA